MVAVNVIDGVKYGFRLLGYLLVVLVVGGLLLAVGGNFVSGPLGRGGNPILALIFILAGVGVIYAGGLGLMYKVIADGVEVGTLSAQRGGGAGNFDSSSGSGGAQKQLQPAPQGHQQARGQGGAQRTQGGTANQGGRGGGQGAQGQQPPADWEPGN